MTYWIRLDRLQVPEDLGENECGWCGETFEQGVVFANLLCDCRIDHGAVCPKCVEFMGNLDAPKGHEWRFPPIEEYRRLEAEWRTPLYASIEEASAVWDREHSQESCA
jgi:hypothetical protein